MELFNFILVSAPLFKFLAIWVLLFWYEGLIQSLITFNSRSYHIFSSFGWIIGGLTWVVVYLGRFLVFCITAGFRFNDWRYSGLLTPYSEFFVSSRRVAHPFTPLTTLYPTCLAWMTSLVLWGTGLILTLNYLLYLGNTIIRWVRVFFYLALFPIRVVWIGAVFFYKTSLKLELYPKPLQRPTLRSLYQTSSTSISYYINYITVSQVTRIFWWKLLVESFTDSFWFLKRFYRINDLMWQDGFLFDFLQKKVVDRWVRTFVIYSGYLFSERLWFDVVVRFYIDFIVWPTYKYSVYEFTSISATLVTILSLLVAVFYIVFLYYLFFLVL